jgi:flagellar basal body P-ring formation protein FlgA
MRRVTTLALFLALATPALGQITGSIPPATPVLKRQATVASELVRIGDLVENAGPLAGTPIFRSPDPGETGSVEAYRVIDAVRAHGLVGVDTRGVAEVIVVRPGRIIGLKDIEAAIARVLVARQAFVDATSLTFTFDKETRPIHLEPSAPAELQATRIAFDRSTGRFDVTFELPGSAQMHGTSLRYTGAVVESRNVLVLARTLARGETVKSGDILVERRPKAGLSEDALEDASEATGLAARRPLRAGMPLRAADLMKRELVQRGDPVTLVYEVPGILLTMRGKALDAGAEGDLVSVVNGQNKRTLQGKVSGPGRVTISSGAARPADPTTVSSIQSDPRGTQRRRTE